MLSTLSVHDRAVALLLAKRNVALRLMGDLPGHEFHGNQWTDAHQAAYERGFHHGHTSYGFQKHVAGRKGSPLYKAYRKGYDEGVDASYDMHAQPKPRGAEMRAAGDVPGHEFHGNQWTEAGSGGIQDKHGEKYQVRATTDFSGRQVYSVVHPGHEDAPRGAWTIASVTLRKEGKAASSVYVDPQFQRRGIASALYKHIEEHIGHKLEPNAALTDEGKAFWKSRSASRHSESPLHLAADAHLKPLTIAVWYAFLKARKAYKDGEDAAIAALKAALRKALPRPLASGFAAGANAGAKMLRTAGDYEGHPFHGNQWTDVGISSSGEVTQSHLDSRFPRAGATVDGRTVLDDVPNQDSIDASLTSYERLPGVREIKMSELSTAKPKFYSASEERRTQALADAIKASGEIKPLIVVFDGHKDGSMYVLEGGHRFDALRLIGAKSFPAIVVVDTEKLRVAELRTLKPTPPSLVMKFDVANPDAVAWAEEHVTELIDEMAKTTRQRIKDAIAAALEAGDPGAAYDDVLDAIGNEDRAQLIARTESMTAAGEGQRGAWSQAVKDGLLPGDATVSWIATTDACSECEALDGSTRKMDETYEGGVLPPLHPNCRCTEGIVG